MRHDSREAGQLRPVSITPRYTEMAAGSVLICCGRTRVICTASCTEGVPPFLKGRGQGWITAEYGMLPGATPQRKSRAGIKPDGRSIEIQRLIGRALRSVCDMRALGERTVYLDCDVIQADGGTRTASITGAFVALCLAVDGLLKDNVIYDSPVRSQLAAVSVGVLAGDGPVADLDYVEDSSAIADMNVVMNSEGGFIEVQGTGEKRPITRAELNRLLELGEDGIKRLMRAQLDALGDAAYVIGKRPTLLVATGNPGKLREVKLLLGDRFDVRSMKEVGIDVDPDETGATFEENALIKAHALSDITGCACIADDSGLEVDALNGAPGVHSARYCGVHGNDAANNDKLLKELDALGDVKRGAQFVSALALTRPGQADLTVRGICRGEVLREPRGTGGFGYDPLFYAPEIGCTFAEATLDQKNPVSHRGRAVQALRAALDGETVLREE